MRMPLTSQPNTDGPLALTGINGPKAGSSPRIIYTSARVGYTPTVGIRFLPGTTLSVFFNTTPTPMILTTLLCGARTTNLATTFAMAQSRQKLLAGMWTAGKCLMNRRTTLVVVVAGLVTRTSIIIGYRTSTRESNTKGLITRSA